MFFFYKRKKKLFSKQAGLAWDSVWALPKESENSWGCDVERWLGKRPACSSSSYGTKLAKWLKAGCYRVVTDRTSPHFLDDQHRAATGRRAKYLHWCWCQSTLHAYQIKCFERITSERLDPLWFLPKKIRWAWDLSAWWVPLHLWDSDAKQILHHFFLHCWVTLQDTPTWTCPKSKPITEKPTHHLYLLFSCSSWLCSTSVSRQRILLTLVSSSSYWA